MDMEITPPELPWPQTGDKLFTRESDWWHNACLGFASDKWSLYAIGYKDAADIIVERVIDTRHGMDLLVFPVTYLYRHYLELRLKELIIHGRQLLDGPDELPHGHRIDVLWELCRPILEKVWPDGATTDLDAVGACITEFYTFDQQSMSFRYPVTKDGTPSLPDLRHVNLRNLRDVVNRLSGLLEGSSNGISAYLDDKRSGESYYL